MSSYIIASAFELSLLARVLQQGIYPLAWAFGFLALASLVSVIVENTEIGHKVRKEMNATGVNVDRYDLLSNVLRSICYALATFGIIGYDFAAIGAYGAIVVCLLFGSRNMFRVNKD